MNVSIVYHYIEENIFFTNIKSYWDEMNGVNMRLGTLKTTKCSPL